VSSNVFPVLKGLTFDGKRRPTWNTGIQPALSGKESAIGYQQYPLYEWELNFEILDHSLVPSELLKLWGLFNAMNGRFDTFLYTDPLFNTLTDEQFGIGDGVTTAFQITAKMQNSGGPGASEIIQNFNGTPVIKKATIVQTSPTNYTLGPTGIVTFVTAPAAAAALTWSGSFYYRCRFLADSMDFSEFMARWWTTKQVAFRQRIL
jgi:uncharacterized protein (TIGR02217 family)